jgi:phosphonatase-like hydrolase
MNIKLVVFDMSGTTVKDNDDVHRFLQAALKKEEVHVSREEVNKVMGYPKPIAIRHLLESKMDAGKTVSEKYIHDIHEYFVNSMVAYYKSAAKIEEKEGVSKTFGILKRNGIKIAIDTGFDRRIADTIIDRLEWTKRDLIDVSITSDEVLNGRPFPDMIFRAMALTGVDNVSEVAKVGDTLSDLQQGNAAGCGLVIGVTTGAFRKEELQQEKHSYLIAQLPEVLDLLGIQERKVQDQES